MPETFQPQPGSETEKLFHRRKFLEFLSASPVVAPGVVSALAGLSALGTDAARRHDGAGRQELQEFAAVE